MLPSFVWALLAIGAGNEPTVDDVEAQVLSSRKRITSGEFVIDATEVLHAFHPPPGPHTKDKGMIGGKGMLPSRWHVWFDGDRFRADKEFQTDDGQPVRVIGCRNCPNQDDFIEGYLEVSKSYRPVLNVRRIAPQDRQRLAYRVYDPRNLGLVFDTVGTFQPLDYVVARAERKDARLHNDMWQGQKSIRIEFETLKTRCATQIVIVPAWGYSVVRIHADVTSELVGGHMVCTVENDVAQVPGTSVWFARVSTYSRSRNGKLEDRQVARVNTVSLNRRIDPRVFSLAGLELAPGTLARTEAATPRKPVMQWDGKKLVDAKIVGKAPAQPKQSRHPLEQTLFWIGSAFAACIAFLSLWFLRRKAA